MKYSNPKENEVLLHVGDCSVPIQKTSQLTTCLEQPDMGSLLPLKDRGGDLGIHGDCTGGPYERLHGDDSNYLPKLCVSNLPISSAVLLAKATVLRFRVLVIRVLT